MTMGFENPLPGIPSVESPFFEQLFADPAIDAETRRIARDLHRDGFAVLDFPDVDFEQVAEQIKANLYDRYNWASWRAHGYAAGHGLRIQDAWTFDANVKRLAVNRRVLDLLSVLFGRRAWPFQTLNFPVGTQQHYHTDSVHFSSVPERFMCGVWTALEDIGNDAGPLLYYPGSHRWPIYTNEHIGVCSATQQESVTQSAYEPLWRALVEQSGITPQTFTPKKGQALIWLSNLLHGGQRHADSDKTRWSQVTHYYFDDCAYYTPMSSEAFLGHIAFRRMRNIATGEVVPNSYMGRPIPAHFIEATRHTSTQAGAFSLAARIGLAGAKGAVRKVFPRSNK